MNSRGKEIIKTHQSVLLVVAASCLLLVNALYCFALSDSRVVFAVACAMGGCAGLLYLACHLLQKRSKLSIEVCFVLVMLVLGVMYSAVFAPSTIPDEMYHFESSYKLADQIMFLMPNSDVLFVRSDDAAMIDFLFAGGNRLTADLYNAVAGSSFFVQDPSIVGIVPVSEFDWGGNPPQVKIASALGIVIAQLFHLGSYPLFYMGRLFNFAFFLVLIYFAVRFTPVCKKAMMTIALLPMTLHVASSYSYDAGIIGLSFLLVSLCLKAIYETGPISIRLRSAIAFVAVMLAPCKVIYTLIVLLVLLIPSQRFSSKRNAHLYKTGVFLTCVLSVLALRGLFLLDLTGTANSSNNVPLDVRGTETGTYYTLGSLINDPLNAILLFLRTFDSMGDYYIKTVIGGSLGWFQPELQAPWFVVLAFIGMLTLSFIKSPQETNEVPVTHRSFFFALTIVGWLAIMMSMALGFTFQTETVILGVQGRYLLPFLPLAAVAMQGNLIIIQKDISQFLIWAMLVLNICYLMRLFAIAVNVN